ncbi:hypothetical protein ACFV14_15795 [Streptomyces zaomyceticus]|uniref:hypothetical protein n=1 Tax=Streptomyces zaomyceticus TaxID=68286 RepID=UPI003691B7DB
MGSWRAPATQETVYAKGATPAGEVVLTRGPGDRSRPEAAAESWEDWTLSLEGEPRVRLRGLGAPGYLSRKLLGRGIDGTWDGRACQVRVASAAARSKRSVDIAGGPVDVRFRLSGLSIQLLQGDECHGVRSAGRWDLSTPTDGAALGACLFEWAEMDYFLRMPGLRLL